MAQANHTTVTGFIFTGLTDRADLQLPLFAVFSLIYGMTLLGNLGMILLIRSDPHLHTPMYFLLSNLSFLDICYSSTVTPNMLLNFLTASKGISYVGCLTQYSFFALFATTEMFLLASMAYDRYVAICNPLLYTVIVTKRVCVLLTAGSYLGGAANSLIHTFGLLRLSFCRSNVINHFFCDLLPLLNLSCSDTHLNKLLVYVFGALIEATTFTVVIVSYIFIIAMVLRIRSAKGRQKTFSTCASHLTAVFTFHGTILFMYFRPRSSCSPSTDKTISVFYTVAIPLLNPLIYSLRNNDVKCAAGKLLKRKVLLCRKPSRRAPGVTP
ncbi:PREDICTED: olfactory receptor 1052-like [Calidris pugnax]|uniref:olfactory receptor 1052-like n=1 Tax=Calidris pugnax TaxID=198806 RepID=UPI00071DF55D|nr:PREDICTED: olfactory receptor 1052-like [Calidris pugnax]